MLTGNVGPLFDAGRRCAYLNCKMEQGCYETDRKMMRARGGAANPCSHCEAVWYCSMACLVGDEAEHSKRCAAGPTEPINHFAEM